MERGEMEWWNDGVGELNRDAEMGKCVFVPFAFFCGYFFNYRLAGGVTGRIDQRLWVGRPPPTGATAGWPPLSCRLPLKGGVMERR